MATNDSDNITKKLKHLGLNLNKIPEHLKYFEALDYRPSRNYDEKSYKTYKYLDIKDIEIFLTPKNRLEDINEKYAKAAPIYAYLVPESETNVERHAKFLEMVSKLNLEKLAEVETMQEILNKNIPFTVKYNRDYLWQIHYSENTNKYFMLVPTEDQDQSTFFYLLKKQLEKKSKKEQKIFVPICYSEYSNEYLRRSEIEELEKYVWFFTKKWPLIYDVYDKKNNLEINITGGSYIYENMVSNYSIKLKNKEEATIFYKLIKALFILQTELPFYYNFNIKLDEKGEIEFYFNSQKITYEYFLEFIKQEYLRIEETDKKTKKEKNKIEKKLEEVKKESTRLDMEYLQKEREIAKYLECKKTFFGKVKYFFTKKKKSENKEENILADVLSTSDKQEKESTDNENKQSNILDKNYYTIEELIKRYKELDKESNDIKNIKLDIEAGELRNKNMELKVKNATLFLDEIDSHTKSIFEFWKFANKDKLEQLQEGQSKEEKNIRLKKTFNYELDIEDFAREIDKRQRSTLSKEEINSIFIASTELLSDINKVANNEKIKETRIEELRKQILAEKKLLESENFDIFGNVASDKTRINTLSNKKHRETKKDKNRILEINRNTDGKEYQEYLENIVKNIKSSLDKSSLNLEISVYSVTSEKELSEHFNVFNLNTETIAKCIEDMKEANNVTLYRLNLKENTKALALTNIIYYDNMNETLPLGMDESEGILLDNAGLKLELKNKKEIRMVCYKEKNNELSDTVIKTINVEEYDVKN